MPRKKVAFSGWEYPAAQKETRPRVALLAGRNLSLLASEEGDMSLWRNGLALTAPPEALRNPELRAISFGSPAGNAELIRTAEVRRRLGLQLWADGVAYELAGQHFFYTMTRAVYRRETSRLCAEVALSVSPEDDVLSATLSANGSFAQLEFRLSFCPHFAFPEENLSQEWEVLWEENRRILLVGVDDIWLAMGARDPEEDFGFCLDEEDRYFGHLPGALTLPELGLRRSGIPLTMIQSFPSGNAVGSFYLAAASDASEACIRLEQARARAAEPEDNFSGKNLGEDSLLTYADLPALELMLCRALQRRPDPWQPGRPLFPLADAGAEGNYLCLAVADTSARVREVLPHFLRASAHLTRCGIPIGLRLLFRGKEEEKLLTEEVAALTAQWGEEAAKQLVLLSVRAENAKHVWMQGRLRLVLSETLSPGFCNEALKPSSQTPDRAVCSSALPESGSYHEKSWIPAPNRVAEEGLLFVQRAGGTDWSYIYAGNGFAARLTRYSAGRSCYGHEAAAGGGRTLTVGENGSAEGFYVLRGGAAYDLCAQSQQVLFGRTSASYLGSIGGDRYCLRIGVDPVLPFRVMMLEIERAETFSLQYRLQTLCGGSMPFYPEVGCEAMAVRCVSGSLAGISLLAAQPLPGCFLFGACPSGGPNDLDREARLLREVLRGYRSRDDFRRVLGDKEEKKKRALL